MKSCKKALSILMSIVLVVGLCPSLAFADNGLTAGSVQLESQEDGIDVSADITLDQAVEVSISNEDIEAGVRSRYLRFAPSESGYYRFYSESDTGDPCVTVYAISSDEDEGEDGLDYIGDNDDNPLDDDETDFLIDVKLEKGVTYYLSVKAYGGKALSCKVFVEKLASATSLNVSLKKDISPLVIGDEDSGDWDTDDVDTSDGIEAEIEYFRFDERTLRKLIDVSATHEGSDEASNLLPYEYDVRYDCSSWTVRGSNNTLTVFYRGKTASVSIPVTDLAHVAAGASAIEQDATVLVNSDDYDTRHYLTFTPPISGIYRFSYEGNETPSARFFSAESREVYYLHSGSSREQCFYDIELNAGSTYYIETRCDEDYKVSVSKAPTVTSLTASIKSDALPLAIGDESLGTWREDWKPSPEDEDGVSFDYFDFYYDAIESLLDVSAVYEGSSGVVGLSSDEYDISYNCSSWSVGNDGNTVTVSHLGKAVEVSVPVTDYASFMSSLPRISEKASTSVESSSYSERHYLAFAPTSSGLYRFSFHGYWRPSISLLTSGGKALDFKFKGYESGEYVCEAELVADDEYCLAMRCEEDFTVSVSKLLPVESISVTLKEGVSPLVMGDTSAGSWAIGDENPEGESAADVKYFYFYDDAIWNLLDVTAKYEGSAESVHLSIDECNLSYDCLTWKVGNDGNTVTVNYRGKSASVSVPVTDLSSVAAQISIGAPMEVSLSSSGNSVMSFTADKTGMYRFIFAGQSSPWVTLQDSKYDNVSGVATSYDYEDETATDTKAMACYLTAGETYYIVMHPDDQEQITVKVTVEKAPDVVKLTASLYEDATPLVYGSNRMGYWEYDEDGVERYFFDAWAITSRLEVKATYDDGTSETLYNLDNANISYDSSGWTADGASNVVAIEFAGVSTSVSMTAISFAEAYANADELALDRPLTATFDMYSNETRAVVFVPPADGDYTFYSSGDEDVVGELFDGNGRWAGYDDDGGTDWNFLIHAELKAGVRYVLIASPFSEWQNTPCSIQVTQNPVTVKKETLDGVDLSGKYVNLALVVDTTGSMYDRIQDVRKNLSSFVKAIGDTGATLRIALVEFKDIEEDGPNSTVVHRAPSQSVWFENGDVDSLLQKIAALDADGGGDTPESTVDALANLVEPDVMMFNSTAARFAFLLTDAPYKDANTHDGIADMGELIAKLKGEGIAVSAVTNKGLFSVYRDLASETGGSLISINDNFADSMGAFAARLAKAAEAHEVDDSIVPVTKVELGEDLTVPVGKVRNFAPVVYPENATNKGIKWEIDDKNDDKSVVEIVRSGDDLLVVKGLTEGGATIIARSLDGGYAASFKFSVEPSVYDEKAKILETCNLDALTAAAKDDSQAESLVFYNDAIKAVSVDEEVQTEIYKAIKGNGKTVSFVYDDDKGDMTHKWTFDGVEITNPDTAVNMDLVIGAKDTMKAMATPVEAVGANQYKTVDFKHSGNLPGEATVELVVDLPNGDDYALYYYDKGKKTLDEVASGVVVYNRVATISIEHCSTYVIARKGEASDTEEGKGDNNQPGGADDNENKPSGGAGAGGGGTSGGGGGGGAIAAGQSIAQAQVEVVGGPFVYDGTEQKPAVTVKLNSKELVADTDYTVAYSNNKNKGKATVEVTGKGLYSGKATATFEIAARPVTVAADAKSKEAGATDPALTATVAGLVGNDAVQYELAREAGEDPGTYRITASGEESQGNYAVTFAEGAFTISAKGSDQQPSAPDAVDSKVDIRVAKVELPQVARAYTGSPYTPDPVVTVGTSVLRKGVDYDVSYASNVDAGTATVTVTGKGSYTGSASAQFAIDKAGNPMKPTAKAQSLKASKLKKKAMKGIAAVSFKVKPVGKAAYKSVSGKKAAKWFKVSKKTGKLTAKKGTPKGIYKVKVRVSAAGDGNHSSAVKVVTAKVRVK